MAAFSYQQHHHPFLLDSSEFIEEGGFFSQFYYPPKFPTHDDHQEMIVGDDNSNNLLDAAAVFETSFGDNHDHHSDDNCNEPSNNNSLVTKNQSATVSSTEQQLTRSTVTTTTTTTRMDKRRKDRTNASSSSFNSAQSKDPREVKSKKPKKGNVNDAKKEGKENDPKADNEKKVAKEPPKDYIHVRARRGQATDSHSLAERVRREKISERMKILQKLVPGCDKVTGKAYMLDEIINYVQFLQNQVEFLSMKLASVNPMFYDFGMDLDNTFMVRPDDRQSLNSIAAASASAPSLQCSPTTQLTAFADTTTTFVPADHHNNYPVLDTELLLQQGQRLNALISQGNGNSLLWDVEDQKQKFLNPSGFTTNLCSFN